METLDIVLSCFLAYGFIRGVWKGFFHELASFLSLMIGFYVTINFSFWVKNWIVTTFSYQSEYLNIIAFIVTFALTVLGIMMFAGLLTKIAKWSGLGLFNKLLGGIFGTLKIALILSVLLYFFSNINQSEGLVKHEKLEKSILYQPLLIVSKTLYPVIQEHFPEVKESKEDVINKVI
ncbi:MAG: CvpA family protein [Flavobacteriales bacterium]|nr:CvpA family protein [Flavobacteriales bacterium]